LRDYRFPLDKRLVAKAYVGTTTVGVKLREYVVLGADRRATAGYYVAHKRSRKIIKVTDYMAMTTAGLVADAQMLAEWLKTQASYYELKTGTRMPVSVAANLLSTLMFSARLFPFIVQLVLGGYDERPRLYNIDIYGMVTEEKYIATGSGSVTAIGIVEDEYSEDMKVEDAVELVKRAILASIRRDAFTGNGIDIVVIGKNVYKEYKFDLKPQHISS